MGSNPACPTKPCPITPPRDDEDRATRIEALNQALLAGGSATETLERWCAGPVVAVRVAGPDRPPDAATYAMLGAVPVRFRQVHLRGGGLLLSEAENWYVPSRLTPAMNAALDTTDVPFGRVVEPLGCHRRTLEAVILADGGAFVLRHHAVLVRPDGLAVCVVRELYTREAVSPP